MSKKTESDYENLLKTLQKKDKSIAAKYPVTNITQDLFVNGTYEIKSGGYYKFATDIVFDPETVDLAGFWDTPLIDRTNSNKENKMDGNDAFVIGWFAAISVQTDEGVVIDMNDKELKQGTIHNLLQRFYAHIELASAPFDNQGPANFGPARTARNVIIKNGKFGRASHHAIHGNNSENILVQDCRMYDWEVAAISMNNAKNFVVNRCNSSTCQTNMKIKGVFSNLNSIKEQLNLLANDNTIKTTAFRYGKFVTTYEQVRNLAKHAMNAAGAALLGGNPGVWASNNEANGYWYKLFAMTVSGIGTLTKKSNGVVSGSNVKAVDGNAYGFVFHQRGVAVHGHAKKQNNPSNNVYVKECTIENVFTSAMEIPALTNEKGAFTKDLNAATLSLFQEFRDLTDVSGGTAHYNDSELLALETSADKYMKSDIWAAWPEIRPQVRMPADSTLGKIAYIFIAKGGSGYTSVPTVTISNGGGSNATATASINTRTKTVTGITITNVGSGYTSHPDVIIAAPGGGGTVANATARITSGSVTSVTIGVVGAGYSAGTGDISCGAPSVSGGVTAVFSLVVNGSGNITGVTIINSGSGYTNPPIISLTGGSSGEVTAVITDVLYDVTLAAQAIMTKEIASPTAIDASGNPHTLLAAISTKRSANNAVFHDWLSGKSTAAATGDWGLDAVSAASPGTITVTNNQVTAIPIGSVTSISGSGGTKYTGTNPTVIFSPPPATSIGGVTATGTVAVVGEAVQITITNPGSGYTSAPTISYTGISGGASASGSNHTLAAVISGTGGSGYALPPSVKITDPTGTEATASATINSSGVVTGINMICEGSGYSATPTVTITPNNYTDTSRTPNANYKNAFHAMTGLSDSNWELIEKNETNTRVQLSLDNMNHITKGAFGVRLDGVTNVFLNGLNIVNVNNMGQPGQPYVGNYKKATAGQNLTGYNHDKAVGISINAGLNVDVKNCHIFDLRSSFSETIGVDVFFSSENNVLDNITMNDFISGKHYTNKPVASGSGVLIVNNCSSDNYRGAKVKVYKDNPTKTPKCVGIRIDDTIRNIKYGSIDMVGCEVAHEYTDDGEITTIVDRRTCVGDFDDN